MKNKIVVVSTITLILLLLGGTSMAWFVSNPDALSNKFTAGTVKVEVLEPGFKNIPNAAGNTTHGKNVKVKSLGSKKTYVRVRLVPMWENEPSLPVSNVTLNLVNVGESGDKDWVDGGDGYYYYKYYLTTGQETSLLLDGVTFGELGPEYEGKTFILKVVAEAVQASNNAYKEVWGRNTLPFPIDQPKPSQP